MDPIRILLRMKRFAQRPPSARTVLLILGLIAVLLFIAGFERFIGVPEWMQAERLRAPR